MDKWVFDAPVDGIGTIIWRALQRVLLFMLFVTTTQAVGIPDGTKERPLDANALNFQRQLIVFEAADCAYCKQFESEVLGHWQGDIVVTRTLSTSPPSDWKLGKILFATPTIVLFEKGREVSRFTGYSGDQLRFWKWLGYQVADARTEENCV